MFTRKQLGALAFVTSAAVITGSGSALTAMPAADAAPGHHALAAHRPATSKTLSSSALARVRDRQRQMVAQHRSAPSFAKAASTTFTVDTTDDSDLADSAGTTCVDAATGDCSLRAAVEAANNLDTPVRIVLRAHTYTLSTAAALTVTDSQGVSVVGKGAGKTSVDGAGSGLFVVSANGDGSPATLFLSSLRLRHGESDFGGAVQLTDNQAGTLVLDHVRANDNAASEQGGALYAYQYNSIYISHSSFTGNHAQYGAAIYQYWADVAIQDTSFTENSTTAGDYGYGGAIDNEYGVFEMTGGSLSHNTAGDGTWDGDGGGIYDDYATTTLTNVHVDHNTASAGAGDGSGIGGAIFSYEDVIEFNGGTTVAQPGRGHLRRRRRALLVARTRSSPSPASRWSATRPAAPPWATAAARSTSTATSTRPSSSSTAGRSPSPTTARSTCRATRVASTPASPTPPCAGTATTPRTGSRTGAAGACCASGAPATPA